MYFAGATRHRKLHMHKWAMPQRIISQELRKHPKLHKWAMPQRVIAQELRDTVNYANGQCRNGYLRRSYELTRKDRMYKNIERLQHAKGPKHFNFIPKTFLIPHEYSEFAATHHRMRGRRKMTRVYEKIAIIATVVSKKFQWYLKNTIDFSLKK